MSEDKKLIRLSFSAISMYLRCGEQFRRRYVLGEKEPPGVALLEGAAIHAATEGANKHKLEKGTQLPARRLIELHQESFEKGVKEAGGTKKLAWDDTAPDENTVYRRAKLLLPEYSMKYDPLIEPAWVEQPVITEMEVNKTAFELVGVIDLTTRKSKKSEYGGHIWDYKSSKSAKNEREARESIQLTLYSGAAKMPQVGMINFVKTKNPYIQVLKSHRDPADIAWAHQIAARVAEAVMKESFPLTEPSPFNWWCSEKFCGFWSKCRGKFQQMRD